MGTPERRKAGTTPTKAAHVVSLDQVKLDSVSKHLRKTLELIQGYMIFKEADHAGPVP